MRLGELEQKEVQKPDVMKVYPNPNRGQFVVEFSSDGPRNIHLYNVLGQRVYFVHTGEQGRIFTRYKTPAACFNEASWC